MRVICYISVTLFAVWSCDTKNTTTTIERDLKYIAFETAPVQSPSLLVNPSLRCFPGEQSLELTLQLKGLVPEPITVQETIVHNSRGLRSGVVSGIKLPIEKDTTVSHRFSPVNDAKLFQTTGLPGLIDSVYHIDVFYTIAGKDGVRVINLVSKMRHDTFVAYRKAYAAPVEIYSFDIGSGFDERQRQFLLTKNIASPTPFVHITEQELALSGLNFKLKCFHRNDTLVAEVFAINHSDMTVRIDPSMITLLGPGIESYQDNLTLEKVTGSKNDPDVLRKGDRASITIRLHAHASPDELKLIVKDAFSGSTGTKLFAEDLKLVRTSRVE